MEADGLTELDVAESIIDAVAIYKRLRSRSQKRTRRLEYLYVIQATNLEGIMIYSKGKFVPQPPDETFYFLVSLKKGL